MAVLARAWGMYWLNACRVVYVVRNDGPITRFGFAYGTLPRHAESGEERFTIEWHRTDDAVWYDILAFSRPHQFLARLGYPLTRRLQKRFATDSAAAMQRVVRPAPNQRSPKTLRSLGPPIKIILNYRGGLAAGETVCHLWIFSR